MNKKLPTKLCELSMFFPLYNEEKNVSLLVKEAVSVASSVTDRYEILLINDGSKDKTREIGEELAHKYPYVRVVNQRNKGYGGAVKRGFKEAKYEWVFYSDGDLQFKLAELKKFIPYTLHDDLIIGYRKKRAEGFKRTLIARMLKVWNMVLLGFPGHIKDIDCAFKLINKSVIANVGELQTDGAMTTTEFLLKAYKKGYTFKQIGVTHFKRKHGTQTGNNFKVIKKAVVETFKLKATLMLESLLVGYCKISYRLS